MDPPRKAYGPVLLSDCAYSTSWQEGGPIIERGKLDVMWCGDRWCAYAMTPDKHDCYGPTPLIAAMRCFVASRLGDEVEVPEELQ